MRAAGDTRSKRQEMRRKGAKGRPRAVILKRIDNRSNLTKDLCRIILWDANLGLRRGSG